MHKSLIFFGSDQYSAIVLNHLIDSGNCQIVGVITDKHNEPTPVGKLANEHNLKVSYYPSNDQEMINFNSLIVEWSNGTLPTGLCASFDHLLPHNIINLFNGNLYNLHPSLLPQYRNVSPVQYALALGDKVTGITLFRISPGIDDGEIIAQVEEQIKDDDTTLSLTSRLFEKGAELFLRFLRSYQNPTRSDLAGHSLIFTHRLTRDSGYIEWDVLSKLLNNEKVEPGNSKNELLNLRLTHNNKGKILHDLLRALSPWPGVWSKVDTKKGELRIAISPTIHDSSPLIHISGKPKPISLADFKKYYL